MKFRIEVIVPVDVEVRLLEQDTPNEAAARKAASTLAERAVTVALQAGVISPGVRLVPGIRGAEIDVDGVQWINIDRVGDA